MSAAKAKSALEKLDRNIEALGQLVEIRQALGKITPGRASEVPVACAEADKWSCAEDNTLRRVWLYPIRPPLSGETTSKDPNHNDRTGSDVPVLVASVSALEFELNNSEFITGVVMNRPVQNFFKRSVDVIKLSNEDLEKRGMRELLQDGGCAFLIKASIPFSLIPFPPPPSLKPSDWGTYVVREDTSGVREQDSKGEFTHIIVSNCKINRVVHRGNVAISLDAWLLLSKGNVFLKSDGAGHIYLKNPKDEKKKNPDDKSDAEREVLENVSVEVRRGRMGLGGVLMQKFGCVAADGAHVSGFRASKLVFVNMKGGESTFVVGKAKAGAQVLANVDNMANVMNNPNPSPLGYMSIFPDDEGPAAPVAAQTVGSAVTSGSIAPTAVGAATGAAAGAAAGAEAGARVGAGVAAPAAVGAGATAGAGVAAPAAVGAGVRAGAGAAAAAGAGAGQFIGGSVSLNSFGTGACAANMIVNMAGTRKTVTFSDDHGRAFTNAPDPTVPQQTISGNVTVNNHGTGLCAKNMTINAT